MSDSEIIDPAALARLLDWGGEKLRDQMVRLFLENSGERLAHVEQGLATGDLRRVERGAHTLKSSAANIGATEVNRLAQRMEEAASRDAADEARSLHAPLTDAHSRACERLREIARGRGS